MQATQSRVACNLVPFLMLDAGRHRVWTHVTLLLRGAFQVLQEQFQQVHAFYLLR